MVVLQVVYVPLEQASNVLGQLSIKPITVQLQLHKVTPCLAESVPDGVCYVLQRPTMESYSVKSGLLKP